MSYDLFQLKAKARELMRTALPSAAAVTLVYLLLTDWVSTLANLFLPSPLQSVFFQFQEQAAQISDPSQVQSLASGMTRLLSQALGSSGARIALFVSVALFLYSLVMEYGFSSYSLSLAQDRSAGFGELFSRFYLSGRIILMELAVSSLVYLWSFLLVIPGIVAWYRYRMARFVLLEHPEFSALRAMQESKRLMQGHKLELLQLDLSFLGWLAVSLLASWAVGALATLAAVPSAAASLLGSAAATAVSLYVLPYMQISYALYYRRLLQSAPAPAQ